MPFIIPLIYVLVYFVYFRFRSCYILAHTQTLTHIPTSPVYSRFSVYGIRAFLVWPNFLAGVFNKISSILQGCGVNRVDKGYRNKSTVYGLNSLMLFFWNVFMCISFAQKETINRYMDFYLRSATETTDIPQWMFGMFL